MRDRTEERSLSPSKAAKVYGRFEPSAVGKVTVVSGEKQVSITSNRAGRRSRVKELTHSVKFVSRLGQKHLSRLVKQGKLPTIDKEKKDEASES